MARQADAQSNHVLNGWLVRLEALQPDRIELGLERVRQVLDRLELELSSVRIITVAGTNGKGSVVAYLEALYQLQGISTLAYTSPHIVAYNERIRINSRPVTDDQLVEAFAQVERARAAVALTYFEFGTLAALVLLARHQPRVAILEVGLGGRLDAVNVVDADIAVITSIGIDHSEWLGPDRHSIAREKAGILRTGRPLVCGEPDPPPVIAELAARQGALLYQYPHDYQLRGSTEGYQFHSNWQSALSLNTDQQLAAHQQQNAATALAAATLLSQLASMDTHNSCGSKSSKSKDTHNSAVEARSAKAAMGAANASMDTQHLSRLDSPAIVNAEWLVTPPARMQQLSARPDVFLDVAHNPHAATALADLLRTQPVAGRTVAVLAMLADKDVAGVAAALDAVIEHWYLAPSIGKRGLQVEQLQQLVAKGAQAPSTTLQSIQQALAKAQRDAGPDDRIIVFGTFANATAILSKET